MLESVLGNGTIEKILFALEAYGQSYPTGLSKMFNIPVNGIQQQLKRLEDGGVVVSLMVGRTRQFQLNPRYPFLKELKALIQRAMEYLPEKEMQKYYRKRTRPRREEKSKFSLTRYKDERVVELVKKTDHKTLAVWAIDCALRVLPYFKEKFPEDPRPRNAIEVLQEWINTGMFKMPEIRKASLASHAAAREVGEDSSARSSARSAGQAVAAAHVPTHSIAAAIYALQAIYRDCSFSDADAAVAKERDWQYQHLLKIRKNKIN